MNSPWKLSGNESLYILELSSQSQNPIIEEKLRIKDSGQDEQSSFHNK